MNAKGREIPDQDVFDADLWAEACDVFGEAQALSHLNALRDELVQYLADTAENSADRSELKQMAHRVTGRTGFLGLAELCTASAMLEEAVQDGARVAPALDRWRAAAQRAVASIPAS